MKLTMRQVRMLRDVTSKDMAKILGVSRWTYTEYEKNPNRMTIDQAMKFCEVCDVDFNGIFFAQDIQNVCTAGQND